jgi:TonB family protein
VAPTGGGAGGSGYGSIDLGTRGKDSTRIVPGKTTVVGGLDREVIERVIRAHQSEIRYCFELSLQKDPSLSGKVGVRFVIDGEGSVATSEVTESSLRSDSTEQCMLGKIRRWRFPSPVGGGIVTVNFPWVFKPAGA